MSSTPTTGNPTTEDPTTEDPSETEPAGRWQVRVDTGGTFTDCLAVDPEGRPHRAKVLSSSALRVRVERVEAPGVIHCDLDPPWVDGFAVGARVRLLDGCAVDPEAGAGTSPEVRVVASGGSELRCSEALEVTPGATIEVRFDVEAPILATRWVTGTPASESLPPLDLRLATTRGTNALLERRGARAALLVTRGFGDLLRIGDQRRSDLFRLDIRKEEPLEEVVEEVWERLAADGSEVAPLDGNRLAQAIDGLVASGIESVAVALLHSYRQPRHERQVVAALERAGIRFVSASAELAPLAKILPRAQTAVVDAYLAPIIGRYLDAVESELGSGGRLQVMTSSGGLARRARFRAKDSLLSGPAGGVVGAAHCGRALGFDRLVAFDMGGTSTDVSRIDGDFEYVFEHRVGGATVSAPALAIETVAAGGGSVCWLDGRQAKVGPQSAGADPGPACYGAGGPLSLTDVNLLLGRLAAERFRIPIHPNAATQACDRLLAVLASADSAAPGREALLEGFRAIADERMADAVRRISVRRGYDPRDYALLAFGGAGGQHACAVAELLGISTVLIPRDAGLLSALGLGAAVVEQIAQEQVLERLDGGLGESLAARLEALADRALGALEADGVPAGLGEVRRRLAFLRLEGQESTLEVEILEPWLAALVDSPPWVEELAAAFRASYSEIYGYPPPDRPIEVESLRVVASTHAAELERATFGRRDTPRPLREQRTFCRLRSGSAADWHSIPVHLAGKLVPGESFPGPALVLDDFATTFVEGGWTATLADNGTLVLQI